ncbi:MAG: hypothetical protein ACE5DY_07155 [Mariprofundaceae bacterium]
MRNIMVKEAKAAIVDVSVIESVTRPKQTVEDIPEDRREDETESVVVKKSADPSAAWLKKGKKSHLGYKLFIVEEEDGFCSHTDMAPANRSEVSHFEHVVNMPRHKSDVQRSHLR